MRRAELRLHLLAVGAAFFTLVCLLAFGAYAVDGLWRPDAFDYAQIGREIAHGNGFSSRQAIYALHLRFIDEHAGFDQPWPNLHRFPLPSLLMAGLFVVFGAGDLAVILYGVICQTLLAMILFLWAHRCFGTVPAVAVVLLFSLNGALLETGCSGLAEPPVLLFFTLSLYLVYRWMTEGRAWRLVIAGVAFGLAILGRTTVGIVLPLLLILLLPRRSTHDIEASRGPGWGGFLVRCVVFSVPVMLVLAPWWIRNILVAGDPLFSLHSYFLLPAGSLAGEMNKFDYANGWVRDFVSPMRYWSEHGELVRKKWSINFDMFLRDLPTLGATWGVSCAAAVALFMDVGERLRGFAWLGAIGLFGTAVVVSLTDIYFDKYYYHFLPLLMFLATGVAWRVLGRFVAGTLRTASLMGLVLVGANLPGIFAGGREAMERRAVVKPEQMEFIEACTDPDAVIFSNLSHVVTWETGRRSIRSHFARNEAGEPIFAALPFHEEFGEIDGIYLSGGYARKRRNRALLGNTLSDERFQKVWNGRRTFKDGAEFFYRSADQAPAPDSIRGAYLPPRCTNPAQKKG